MDILRKRTLQQTKLASPAAIGRELFVAAAYPEVQVVPCRYTVANLHGRLNRCPQFLRILSSTARVRQARPTLRRLTRAIPVAPGPATYDDVLGASPPGDLATRKTSVEARIILF